MPNPFHATGLSIPPENVRKPEVFIYFQWVLEKPLRQDFVLEMEHFKTNGQFFGTNKLPSLNDITFYIRIGNILMLHWSSYDNILLMGNFNVAPGSPKLKELITYHELCSKSLEPTCFKSINPAFTDNFLKNNKSFYKKSDI